MYSRTRRIPGRFDVVLTRRSPSSLDECVPHVLPVLSHRDAHVIVSSAARPWTSRQHLALEKRRGERWNMHLRTRTHAPNGVQGLSAFTTPKNTRRPTADTAAIPILSRRAERNAPPFPRLRPKGIHAYSRMNACAAAVRCKCQNEESSPGAGGPAVRLPLLLFKKKNIMAEGESGGTSWSYSLSRLFSST